MKDPYLRIKHLLLVPVLIASFFILGGGCDRSTPEPPENLITEDVYIDLVVEMQLIRVWHNTKGDSVNVDSLKQAVFLKYEVSEDQFISSHTFYEQQIKAQKQRLSKAIERLEAELSQLEEQINQAEENTPTPQEMQ